MEIRVREVDAGGKGAVAERSVAYKRLGGRSFWTPHPRGVEEWLHLDETVEIPGMPGKQFKVIELRADQVLVEELDTKRALSIPKR